MMEQWSSHLIILPILLPMVSAALLILFSRRNYSLRFGLSAVSTAAQFAAALCLLQLVEKDHWSGGIGVYLAANWVAPFGIALVVDRLAVLMLLLTSVMGLGALWYSYVRWGRVGVHYFSLFQFLLMGLNGAFLTGDLFNLFVFFEVMLAASYGLVLHGYNSVRVRASMQFIVVNLLCSLLFLIGVALIYAATGTLNMADIAAKTVALNATDRQLLHIAAAILAVAFLTKSAIWPLSFWLPTTYSAASPPVAAMLVLVTKVGIYTVLRLWSLIFSHEAGGSAYFGAAVLLWGGVGTIAFGLIGMYASQEPGRLASYSAIISSGTLLAVISYGQVSLTSAALFYLLSSTLAVAAFMLLIELIERIRNPAAAMLALTMEAFAIEDEPGESAGVAVPGALAFLGLAFAGCALIMAGLPPLSGFIAKFSIFHALLTEHAETTLGYSGWTLLILIVVSGFAAVLALMRFGVRTFWASPVSKTPRLQVTEAAPIFALVLICVLFTVQAGPLKRYLDRTAASLHAPQGYIQQVLSQPAVPNPGGAP
ncbi:MAG: monovalent cation/H+ antiporter subunit D [Cellvibrionaceae bacterium]|nr:monovalent cation/H+ antiporter subunit D [Cellvibrionaceae bacterium]